jgi:hypothetical protein
VAEFKLQFPADSKAEEGGYELSEPVFFGTAVVGSKSGISWEEQTGNIPQCSDVQELIDRGIKIGMISVPCAVGDHRVMVTPLKGQRFVVGIDKGIFVSCPRCGVTHEKKSASERDLCAYCVSAPPLEKAGGKKKKKSE